MTAVYVAAGSNVEPESNLARALDALRRSFPGLAVSSCYRNKAFGFEGEDFLNLVTGFETELTLDEVLSILRRIEADCGRSRDAPKWAPRSMDLDVLLFDDLVCSTPSLTLPRPDLLRRAYMLGPLAELAPELVHPTAHRTIGTLWSQFDQEAHPLERVELGQRRRNCAGGREPV
jgi:2-amino-4-hydroxy-6-hydroxymethyldihydropteridine diphosphokinase